MNSQIHMGPFRSAGFEGFPAAGFGTGPGHRRSRTILSVWAVALLVLAGCRQEPEIPPVATAAYFISIGTQVEGQADVRYTLDMKADEPFLAIDNQTILRSEEAVVFDSTEVVLRVADHAPVRSRKVIVAGEDRKYANAVYQDSTVLLTTGTPKGVFPLYVHPDTAVVDKEQLMFGIGLRSPEEVLRGVQLRAVSADAQRQLRVDLRVVGQEQVAVPLGTFSARKVRMAVRRYSTDPTEDLPEHEVFLWYGDDGRLLRYYDPNLQAVWLLTDFGGDLSAFHVPVGDDGES